MKDLKTMQDYTNFAKTTDSYHCKMNINNLSDVAFITKVLGLVGESGETADKVKKIIRNKGGVASSEDITELKKELGDVLWYITLMAEYLGSSLEEIAGISQKKLSDRQKRGVITSEGDNR